MRYVKRIESNIKGGVAADLGPRTLILGRNGTGKSAIVNSLELALTGKVSDVVGRAVVADVNQILTLGPGESIFASATLDDGTVLRTESKGKKLAASTAGILARLPLRDIREALAGSVEAVRRFFLGMAASGVTMADVRSAVPTPFHDLLDEALAGTPQNRPAVDLLLAALDAAKTKLKAIRDEASAGMAVADDVGRGLPPPPSEGDLEAARQTLRAARDEVEAQARFEGTRQRLEDTDHAVEEALAHLDNIKAEVTALPADAQPHPVDSVREHLLVVFDYAARSVLDNCPCCKRTVNDQPMAPNEFWAARAATVRAKHEERQKLFTAHGRLHAALTSAEAGYAGAVTDRNRAAESADMDPGKDLSALRSAADVAEQRVIGMERAQEAWAGAKRARDAAAARGISASRWELLVDALKTAVGKLLDQRVEAFTARVQQFLPGTDRFHLRLRDGDREVCQYGFLRDGDRFDIALSGAEWARLGAALAAAMLPDGFDGLAVAVPEDRSWDSDTLAAVLEALARAPCQVVLATTTEPRTVPADWTVVRVGDAVPAPAMSEPAGSYIGFGTCPHGVAAGGTCTKCEAEATKDTTKRARKARKQAPAAAPAAAPRGAPTASDDAPTLD